MADTPVPTMIKRPSAKRCQNVGTPTRIMLFCTMTMSSVPSITPVSEPVPPVVVDALALAVHTIHGRHRVVHDLALERGHRRELFALTRRQHPLGHLLTQCRKLVATLTPPARDVQHQATTLAGLLVHGQAGQFLERVQHLTLPTYQLGQIVAAVDADDRAIAFDVQIDVTIEVQQIEELLEVVAGDLAFGNQALFEIITLACGSGC